MRQNKGNQAVILMTAALTACAGWGARQAFGSDGTWLAAPVDSIWTNSANWAGGIIPGDSNGASRNAGGTTFVGSQNVTFDSSAITTIEPDLNRRVNKITFTSGSGDYTIGASTSSNPLYIGGLDGTTGNKTLTFNSVIQTISDATVSAGTGQVFTFNSKFNSMAGLVTNFSGTGAINFNAGIGTSGANGTATVRFANGVYTVSGATPSNQLATLSIAGTGTLNLNAADISSGWSNGSSTLSLATTGAGQIDVNTANAISGTARVSLGAATSGTTAMMVINESQSYTGRYSAATATNTNASKRTAGTGIGTLVGNVSSYDPDSVNEYNGMPIIGANGYTISAANTALNTLWVNNATGSATGNSDVNIVAGTLGGNGFIVNSDVTIDVPNIGDSGTTPTVFAQGVTLHKRQVVTGLTNNTGYTDYFNGATPSNLASYGLTASGAATYGKLSPGASAGAVGTLTMDLGSKGLNIAYAVEDANTQALLFDLVAPGSSDQVSLLNSTVLNIGAGGLEFDDFAFNLPTATLAAGTYTLFDSSQLISGSLGANLSGTLDGQLSTLSLADGGRDLVLTVVPEPGTLGLLAAAGMGLLVRRHRMA